MLPSPETRQYPLKLNCSWGFCGNIRLTPAHTIRLPEFLLFFHCRLLGRVPFSQSPILARYPNHRTISYGPPAATEADVGQCSAGRVLGDTVHRGS